MLHIIYIDLHILNYLCITICKSHLIMVYGPFNMLFNYVYWYFIEGFYIHTHQGYYSVIFL